MAFKPKILIVEDDTAMLRLLGEVLGEMGAEPHCLANSLLAAELVEREKFDGVFLDWRMPELDGLELARRIRRSRSNARVPLVMLTGVAAAGALEESFHAGVNFFLQKPVTVDKLRHLMNASRGLMLEERRRYQRVPASLPVRLRWDNQQINAQTLNLSASGVLLEMDGPPPEGTGVTLEFTLPDDAEPLECAGTVARRAPGRGVAVRFHFYRREQRLRLTRFVEQVRARLDADGDGSPPYV